MPITLTNLSTRDLEAILLKGLKNLSSLVSKETKLKAEDKRTLVLQGCTLSLRNVQKKSKGCCSTETITVQEGPLVLLVELIKTHKIFSLTLEDCFYGSDPSATVPIEDSKAILDYLGTHLGEINTFNLIDQLNRVSETATRAFAENILGNRFLRTLNYDASTIGGARALCDSVVSIHTSRERQIHTFNIARMQNPTLFQLATEQETQELTLYMSQVIAKIDGISSGYSFNIPSILNITTPIQMSPQLASESVVQIPNMATVSLSDARNQVLSTTPRLDVESSPVTSLHFMYGRAANAESQAAILTTPGRGATNATAAVTAESYELPGAVSSFSAVKPVVPLNIDVSSPASSFRAA